jgi:hypothetical protein
LVPGRAVAGAAGSAAGRLLARRLGRLPEAVPRGAGRRTRLRGLRAGHRHQGAPLRSAERRLRSHRLLLQGQRDITTSPQMQRCALRLDRAAARVDVDLLPYHVPGLTLVVEGIDGASRCGSVLAESANVEDILAPIISDREARRLARAADRNARMEERLQAKARRLIMQPTGEEVNDDEGHNALQFGWRSENEGARTGRSCWRPRCCRAELSTPTASCGPATLLGTCCGLATVCRRSSPSSPATSDSSGPALACPRSHRAMGPSLSASAHCVAAMTTRTTSTAFGRLCSLSGAGFSSREQG